MDVHGAAHPLSQWRRIPPIFSSQGDPGSVGVAFAAAVRVSATRYAFAVFPKQAEFILFQGVSNERNCHRIGSSAEFPH